MRGGTLPGLVSLVGSGVGGRMLFHSCGYGRALTGGLHLGGVPAVGQHAIGRSSLSDGIFCLVRSSEFSTANGS